MTLHRQALKGKGRNPVLVAVRRRKGWTLQQLADAVGMSKARISLVESGKKPASPKLARALLDKGLVGKTDAQKMLQSYIQDRIFSTKVNGKG